MGPARSAYLLILTGVVALAGGAACSMGASVGDDGSGGRTVAEVDRLDVPDRIAASDTLSARLLGTVGPNGCYSFDRFDVERTAGRLTVTPLVRRRGGEGGMCTMALVPLDETYVAPPPFLEDTLVVVVPQPDRPDVTATIDVTSDAR